MAATNFLVSVFNGAKKSTFHYTFIKHNQIQSFDYVIVSDQNVLNFAKWQVFVGQWEGAELKYYLLIQLQIFSLHIDCVNDPLLHKRSSAARHNNKSPSAARSQRCRVKSLIILRKKKSRYKYMFPTNVKKFIGRGILFQFN